MRSNNKQAGNQIDMFKKKFFYCYSIVFMVDDDSKEDQEFADGMDTNQISIPEKFS